MIKFILSAPVDDNVPEPSFYSELIQANIHEIIKLRLSYQYPYKYKAMKSCSQYTIRMINIFCENMTIIKSELFQSKIKQQYNFIYDYFFYSSLETIDVSVSLLSAQELFKSVENLTLRDVKLAFPIQRLCLLFIVWIV